MLAQLNVLTVPEAAQILRATPEQIREELEAGAMSGFKIAGEWRTTEDALLAKIRGEGALPYPQEVRPRTLMTQHDWERVEEFVWRAPMGEERYHYGYRTLATLPGGKQIPFVIGYTMRPAYGKNRKRVSVLWEYPNGHYYAVVEFVGADDEKSNLVLSLLRNENNKNVRPGDTLPAGYENLTTAVFSEYVSGKKTSRSIAVIAHENEHDQMLHHALLRCEAKGWDH